MQLKLQRSQREGGVVSKSVIFCLDARVEFTPAEQASITRYKLHKQVIYNSEAAQKHLASAGMSMATGNMIGSLKGMASAPELPGWDKGDGQPDGHPALGSRTRQGHRP